MQEMDLDELDQEVSKLMGQAGKAKAAKAADDNDVVTVATSKKADTPAPAAKDDSAFVPVRRANLQVTPRKNGVAMDIVQPKPSQIQPPSAKAARVAPTLQPDKSIKPEEPPKPEAPAKAEKEVSDDTLASLDMQIDATKDDKKNMLSDPDHEAHKSVWPDPLEVHGFKDDKTKGDKPEESMVDPSMAEPPKENDHGASMEHSATAVIPPAEAEKAEEPVKEADTPFVQAKVEKRPLGAYADTAKEEPKPEEEKPEDKPADDTPADSSSAISEPASIAIQTPKELSPEVVAVESSEPQFTPPAPKLEDNETDMNHLRQMSIPQQYKDKEAKPSDKDRPIFDTKEYHPALKPAGVPARSGSRTGTVITIILILLMVAAAAVAYFVVTGGLDLSTIL